MKINAAIIILVGRPDLFPKTLKSFYKNWNNKFKYPIYVHYLRDIFSKKDISYYQKKYKNIFFERVYPKIPNHIKEKDLFYNLVYNDYAYTNFTKGRLGYLHVIYFTSNVASFGKKGCLSKKMQKYDFIMRLDDDAWFRKKINFDLFKKVKKYHMATGKLTITKSSQIHFTRERLFSFLKKYIKENKIVVKNKNLKSVLKSNNGINLYRLPYSQGNFDIYNMKTFKSKKFQKFIENINKFGGQYKFRWADYDITNLFLYMYYQNPIASFDFSETVYMSSHPDAKRILDENSLYDKIYFYLLKRIKRFFFKFINKNKRFHL